MHCNAYRLQKLWLLLIWAQVGGGINYDVTARGKRSLAIDLKHPEGFKVMQKLCGTADVLIEPFRPGVMERLGFGECSICSKSYFPLAGPDVVTRDNPKLVYARLTGSIWPALNEHYELNHHNVLYFLSSSQSRKI